MPEGVGRETLRTYEEINAKIKKGDAVVMTADEFVDYTKTNGIKKAARDVDVVTTGTFGIMCSSGAFLNFGHTEPPIRMNQIWLNDVPAYGGIAAVDTYIGAAAMSEIKGFDYGGGHVIEELVSGRDIELRAESYGTDCYPRKFVETTVNINEMNQAVLLNPRNAYQRYDAATNGTDQIIYTYMGTLLPKFGNISYSGSGQLSPIYKDRGFETLGTGTRIFLGGGIGYIIGEGTQHNPQSQLGTLMVRGDLKQMKPQYLRGASVYRYGTSLYLGLGVPIPIINMRVAKTASLPDSQIFTELLDYGAPSRSRPVLAKVSYAELKSGTVRVKGKETPSSPMSSFKQAMEIAETLKSWIMKGKFTLSKPVELLPRKRTIRPLEIRKHEPKVRDIMTAKVVTARTTDDIGKVSNTLVKHSIDHMPITDKKRRVIGIVTSWDITKAVAQKKTLREVMTRRVVTVRQGESIDIVARRLLQHNISGAPVVDENNKLIGIVTTDDMTKLLRRNID